MVEMNDIEIFVKIDSRDNAEDEAQTSFPSPKYYARGTESRPKPVWLLHFSNLHPGHDSQEHLFLIKAAMGRELVENTQNQTPKPARALDDWNSWLDSDPNA